MSPEEVSAERVGMMKRFLGLTVLIFGLSVPAHAQAKGGGAMAGVSSSGGSNGGGAGAGGYGGGAGGGESGVTSFHTLPHVSPANLRSTDVSGSDASFVPSSFLPYSQAIAAGQAILDTQHKTVAEVAAENNRVHRLKARASIIENGAGDPVIAIR
ncbi:MAG TPA: hypothetical protein VHX49_04765 [Candidatus Acidoferrales bacterium]|jgi:hypothetical protein|nr:hypothetical protein [Candidatus Acidoferrales bacterium]